MKIGVKSQHSIRILSQIGLLDCIRLPNLARMPSAPTADEESSPANHNGRRDRLALLNIFHPTTMITLGYLVQVLNTYALAINYLPCHLDLLITSWCEDLNCEFYNNEPCLFSLL